MSDNIYFNIANKFSLKKSVLNLATRLHHRVAPSHAEKTARKLLLTPARMKPKNTAPQGLIKGSVRCDEGVLTTYQLGTGPIWVLTHGWSGSANQFYPLMQHIAEQGFTALAYDHPAHGHSEGEVGHMPAFVNGLETILDSVDNLSGVIGHSMGTVTAIECSHPKLNKKPLLLIAPLLDYLDILIGTVERSGYSMRLFNSVVEKVEKQYNYPLNSINPFEKLKAKSSQTIIVHDPADKFANFNEAERAAKEIGHVELIPAQEQGHGRIMKSQQVMDAFDQLVTS